MNSRYPEKEGTRERVKAEEEFGDRVTAPIVGEIGRRKKDRKKCGMRKMEVRMM